MKDRVKKSAGKRMHRLCNYVEKAEKHESVEAVFYLNVLSDATGDAEMIALAEANPHAKSPVRHIIFSWREGEQPTHEQIEQAAKIAMQEMGVENCAAKVALHKDTENWHIHLVVCTTDPETLKATPTEFIVEAIHRAAAKIDHVQGWQPEENARYKIDAAGICIRNDSDIRQKKKMEIVDRLEHFSGQRSAQDIAIEVVGNALKCSASWSEFHAQLAAAGLEYQTKGSGAVIAVTQGEETIFVKASTASRGATLKTLEARYGAFQPCGGGVYFAERTPEPARKLGQDQKVLWKIYRAEKDQFFETKRSFRAASISERRAEFANLAVEQRAERQAIFHGRSWKGKGAELAALRSLLAAKHAKKKAELIEFHKSQRERLRKLLNRPFPKTIAEWINIRGHAADATGRHIVGDAQEARAYDIRDYLPQLFAGEVQYINFTGQIDLIDSGRMITVVQDEFAAIRAALQLAETKWPSGFVITGPADFQERMLRQAVALGLINRLKDPMQRAMAMQLKEQPRHTDMPKSKWAFELEVLKKTGISLIPMAPDPNEEEADRNVPTERPGG